MRAQRDRKVVVGLCNELVVVGVVYLQRERDVKLAICVYISRFNNLFFSSLIMLLLV